MPSPTTWAIDFTAAYPLNPKAAWRYCPIFLLDDGKQHGIPPLYLKLFARLAAIQETEHFQSALQKLAEPIQKKWADLKERLSSAITPGADFKKWPPGGPGVFSVRVGANFRAHLRYISQSQHWLAIQIGTHKELGHG